MQRKVKWDWVKLFQEGSSVGLIRLKDGASGRVSVFCDEVNHTWHWRLKLADGRIRRGSGLKSELDAQLAAEKANAGCIPRLKFDVTEDRLVWRAIQEEDGVLSGGFEARIIKQRGKKIQALVSGAEGQRFRSSQDFLTLSGAAHACQRAAVSFWKGEPLGVGWSRSALRLRDGERHSLRTEIAMAIFAFDPHRPNSFEGSASISMLMKDALERVKEAALDLEQQFDLIKQSVSHIHELYNPQLETFWLRFTAPTISNLTRHRGIGYAIESLRTTLMTLLHVVNGLLNTHEEASDLSDLVWALFDLRAWVTSNLNSQDDRKLPRLGWEF